MLGCIGPWQEALEPGEDCWAPRGFGGPCQDLVVGDQGCSLGGVWCTFNKRIRTGTDKGNLTV
jgi:hypothetical protein